MKAIKEGRKPTPGPPGGEEEQDEAEGVVGDGGEGSPEEQPSINASEYYRRGGDGAHVEQEQQLEQRQQSEEKRSRKEGDSPIFTAAF
mmetsp:Transcript_39315/g.62977  ORF Transcript_39315/g.62977 Transcript_39315/m.62977 type:complete len:88 (+) Transcript_39315:666-929(+)